MVGTGLADDLGFLDWFVVKFCVLRRAEQGKAWTPSFLLLGRLECTAATALYRPLCIGDPGDGTKSPPKSRPFCLPDRSRFLSCSGMGFVAVILRDAAYGV